MNIYVGNLNYKVKDEELLQLFAEYGEVSSAKIITDKYSGQSKGFGFVTMEDKSEAITAIKELNGRNVENKEIVVNEARPKSDNFFKR